MTTWKDNIQDCLQGQNLWCVTMGKEEKLVVLVAAGQVVSTKGAIFKARWQLANYLQQVNTALSMINLSQSASTLAHQGRSHTQRHVQGHSTTL
jgi:hypothetical protein